MVYVRQRYLTDCGVACFAMILDLPYERVFRICYPEEPVDITFGINLDIQDKLLTTVGVKYSWRERVDGSIDIDSVSNRALLSIRVDRPLSIYPCNHAVVWEPKSKTIWDPFTVYTKELQYYRDRVVGILEILPRKKWWKVWA